MRTTLEIIYAQHNNLIMPTWILARLASNFILFIFFTDLLPVNFTEVRQNSRAFFILSNNSFGGKNEKDF